MKSHTDRSLKGDYQAFSDQARDSMREHLAAACDALAHGEDDNAQAHVLDALIQMGRTQAFLDAIEILEEGDDQP